MITKALEQKSVMEMVTLIFIITTTQNLSEKTLHTIIVSLKKLRFFYDKDGLCALRTIIGNETKDYIYIRNPFNDIVGISEGNTIKAYYVYDAWGNHKIYNPDGTLANLNDSTFIGNINPFRYRSYYYDVETNLYYLMSRYYDPEIGQFISPDDMEYMDFNSIAGINLYAYCNNNPVMNYDPLGRFIIESLLALLIVAGVQSAIGAIQYTIWDSNKLITFDDGLLTIKYSYLIPGYFAKRAFLNLVKNNYQDSWNSISNRNMDDYILEWYLHNSAAYIFLATAMVTNVFDKSDDGLYAIIIGYFLQAASVDMEDEKDWWELWKHLL